MDVEIRQATVKDIAGLEAVRAPDEEAGPADPRMARYLLGQHHPQFALTERVVLIGESDGEILGYVGGHRTTRHECGGELQYLYMTPGHRRSGVAGRMVGVLAEWFESHGVRRVCVDVDPENRRARAFYARHGAVVLNSHWMVWEDLRTSLGDANVP